MNKKITGTLITALFSLSILSGNAFAHNKHVKNKVSSTSTKVTLHPQPLKHRFTYTRPRLNVNGPNDSRFRSVENTKDIYSMNGTIPGNSNLNTGTNSSTGSGAVDNNADLYNNPANTDLNNTNNTTTNNTDNTTSNANKDMEMYDHLNQADNPAPVQVTPSITTVIGQSGLDPFNPNNVNNCINQLSTVDGAVVKNDAFFSCQRYKWR